MRLAIPLLLLGACKGPDEPEPAGLQTLATAQRLAGEGVERWPSDQLALSWIETVWHFGLVRLHERDEDARWEGAWDSWLDRGLGFFQGTQPREFESSDSMSPSTLASIRLAREPGSGMEPIVDAAWHYLDQVAPRTAEGAITHWGEESIGPSDEVWVDSQFMFGMFLLAEYDRTGDPALVDRFVEQYELFSDLCRDPADQLYRHAYSDGTGQNIPVDDTYWARGNSWVLISAAELLARVPEDDPAANQVRPLFQEHASAVMALQADDGLWHTVLNSPRGDDPANYTETSASALIGYALVRGTGTALDARDTEPVVRTLVDGLDARMQEQDGEIVLSGTSFGTNPGDYDYYVSVPQFDQQVLGVGSVVMFLAEADGLGEREP